MMVLLMVRFSHCQSICFDGVLLMKIGWVTFSVDKSKNPSCPRWCLTITSSSFCCHQSCPREWLEVRSLSAPLPLKWQVVFIFPRHETHLCLRRMSALYWCCQHDLKSFSHLLFGCGNRERAPPPQPSPEISIKTWKSGRHCWWKQGCVRTQKLNIYLCGSQCELQSCCSAG